MTKFRGHTCAALLALLLPTPALADVGADMEAEGDVGAEMSAEGGGTADSKGKATGNGAAAGDAPDYPVAGDDAFAAPNGQLGAGLSLSPAQAGRVWGELGFHTQERYMVLSPIIGGGYKVMDQLELELVIPMAYASIDAGLTEESTFVLGNVYAGANYIAGEGELKYKVGGGLGLPTSSAGDIIDALAYASAGGIRGFQDFYYWWPESLTMNGIGRIEYGTQLVFTGDVSLSFFIPIGDYDNDNEFTLGLTPGIGYWASEDALLGGRINVWFSSFGGDSTQFGLEPFFRYMLGDSAFLNARFTLNLDRPAGFAFDEGRFWGLHLGGGAAF
jgi:hypothetical protein